MNKTTIKSIIINDLLVKDLFDHIIDIGVLQLHVIEITLPRWCKFFTQLLN